MTSPKFRKELFDQAVHDYGYDVLIEKSEMCSCYQEEQSESTPICPRCKGLKFIWKPYGVVRALITGISEKNNQYLDFSMVKQGDKMMTLQEKDKIAINDRIKALNTYELYTEVLIPVKQENGILYFEPYFDVASILEAKDEDGKDIQTDSLFYNESTGFLNATNGKTYEKIAIRYSYHPYYLVGNIPHTNRQQYAQEGDLMFLPGQYYLSRITAPVKTTYATSLISRDLIVDFSDQQSVNISACSKSENKQITFEFAFNLQSSDKLVLLKRTEAFVGEPVEAKGVASGSLQLQYSDVKVEENDFLVFIRDKYIPELTFKDMNFNCLLKFVGDNLMKTTSWNQIIPEEGTRAIANYDYIFTLNRKRAFTFLNSVWVEESVPFELYIENFRLYLVLGDNAPVDLGIQLIANSKNYVALVCNNASRFSSSFIYCNGTRFQMTETTTLQGALHNATIYSQADILKRVYADELNQFELSSNKNFIYDN